MDTNPTTFRPPDPTTNRLTSLPSTTSTQPPATNSPEFAENRSQSFELPYSILVGFSCFGDTHGRGPLPANSPHPDDPNHVTIHPISHPIDRNCRSPVCLRPSKRSLFRPIPLAPTTPTVADHCRPIALAQTITTMLLIGPAMPPIDRNLASKFRLSKIDPSSLVSH
ncbi:Hypothetical predicted protein, partial [Olea europaea subsp. europaea]